MKKLITRSCEEIMTTVYKPIEFVIDGLIAQGLYILAGAPKVGKVLAGTGYVPVNSERRKNFRPKNFTRNCSVFVFRGQLRKNTKQTL